MAEKIMCKMREPYRCARCGNEMLFFVTRWGSLIDYKRFYLKHNKTCYTFRNALARYDPQYFKCICCNKLYLIDWTTGFPVQVTKKEAVDKFVRKPS